MYRIVELSCLVAVAFVGMGCGLDVSITSTPNPTMVGKPTKLTINVTNTNDECTVEEIGLCLFPFATPTEAQRGLLDQARELAANGSQTFAAKGDEPAGFPCEIDIAGQPFDVVGLPTNGVTCTKPAGSGPIACSIGTLAPDQTVSFMLTVTPSKAGTFTNVVNVMGSVVGGGNCMQGDVAMDTAVEEILVKGGAAAPLLSRFGLLMLALLLVTLGTRRLRRMQRRASRG